MFCEKIASLALCAVTAASCCLCPWPWPSWPGGSGSSSSSSSSSSAPDIDYSAILEGDLPDGAKKDFITFEDNSADESALQNALGSLSAQATGSVQEGQVTPIYNTSPGYGQTVEDFVKACGIKNTTLKRGNSPDGMTRCWKSCPPPTRRARRPITTGMWSPPARRAAACPGRTGPASRSTTSP